MTTLSMMLTAAGLDALVDAQNGETEAIAITEIGLTETAFVMAPTLTALPGEFTRLESFAGQSVSETIIHMTALDPTEQVYDLRGLGLFLGDGTLFAVYGQDDPIFRKVTIASFLLAFDVAFSADISGSITFGDSTFLYPPASETVKGVAEIATQDEANAGVDDERIITPLKLKVILAALKAAIDASIAGVAAILNALLARTITGGGLVTGGGNLTGNRTLTVEAANLAETDAAMISNKAVVPSSLVNILANIAGLLARTISGGGLVTGGGNLTANRTLTVTAATGVEIAAGTNNAKAATPLAIAQVPQTFGSNASILGLGGAITKMGSVSVPQGSTASISFPIAFPTACDRVLISPQGDNDGGDESDENWWVPPGSISASGFQISTSGDGNTISYGWVAWGH